MSPRRDEIISKLIKERIRQFNLPGSEFDERNTPNDWVAIAMHYLGEEVRRGGSIPNAQDFEDSLIKAGAVIVAALEHLESMAVKGSLLGDFGS